MSSNKRYYYFYLCTINFLLQVHLHFFKHHREKKFLEKFLQTLLEQPVCKEISINAGVAVIISHIYIQKFKSSIFVNSNSTTQLT